jgi:membrane-associated phospholipid phosphatase
MKNKFLLLFFLVSILVQGSSFARESTAIEKKDSVAARKDSTKTARKDSIIARKDSISARKDSTTAARKDSVITRYDSIIAVSDSITAIKDSTIAVKKDSVAQLPVKPDVSYLKAYWVDGKAVATAPFHWSYKEWIAASAVVGVGITLYTLDDDIQKLVLRNKGTQTNVYLSYGLDPLGSGLYSIPTLAVLYGYGAIVKNDKAKETALKGLEAFILTGITVQIIKELTQRHRPYTDNPSNPYLWNGPYNLIPGAPYTSFPSGHSAAAFAVATVLSLSYRKTVWVPIVCMTLASLTAMARVVENNHWASDAFIGSAIGLAIGRLVYQGSYKRLEILPVSAYGTGVTLIYHL